MGNEFMQSWLHVSNDKIKYYWIPKGIYKKLE